jgi:hypothetical protein
MTLDPEDRVFSESVVGPVRGQPSLFPCDEDRFWLGVDGTVTMPDGKVVELPPEAVSASAVMTLQHRNLDKIMKAPTVVDPETMHSVTDPYGFQSINEIAISRPAYLQVLAVVLVVPISVSALTTLHTHGPDDLARRNRCATGTMFEGWIVGTPEQVRSRVQASVDAGLNHFMLWFIEASDHVGMRLFAEQVVPRLRS